MLRESEADAETVADPLDGALNVPAVPDGEALTVSSRVTVLEKVDVLDIDHVVVFSVSVCTGETETLPLSVNVTDDESLSVRDGNVKDGDTEKVLLGSVDGENVSDSVSFALSVLVGMSLSVAVRVLGILNVSVLVPEYVFLSDSVMVNKFDKVRLVSIVSVLELVRDLVGLAESSPDKVLDESLVRVAVLSIVVDTELVEV